MEVYDLKPRHGVICSMPNDEFGYFGWPSVARTEDGTIWAVASGMRYWHVCPWGRTVLFKSTDNGATWSAPRVITNTPLDDRDAGIVALPDNRLAVTWFTSNTQIYRKGFEDKGFYREQYSQPVLAKIDRALANISDEERWEKSGSWIRVSADGEQWSSPRRAPVNTPHGFIVLKDGSWLYFGKKWEVQRSNFMPLNDDVIMAARSTDEGLTWENLGVVPTGDYKTSRLHEPHVVELPDGRLLGAIRYESPFSIIFTESNDGGRTWSEIRNPNIAGSPPHLLLHSSGKLICSYGYRLEPFGERVAISDDLGKTWTKDFILFNGAPNGDLGYPCTIELPGGDLLTVYYQHLMPGDKASFLCTRWSL